MSEKRISGSKNQLIFVFEKLHEGIATADYRREKSKEEIIPHSTLHDHLKYLEAVRVAYEDTRDGKWYYTWKQKKEKLIKQHQKEKEKHKKEIEEYQTYKTPEERQEKLQLSEELMKEVLDNEIPFPVLIKDSPYLPYFLQHLESGYPVLFKYWEDLKKLESEKKR